MATLKQAKNMLATATRNHEKACQKLLDATTLVQLLCPHELVKETPWIRGIFLDTREERKCVECGLIEWGSQYNLLAFSKVLK